jgi:hypothetical protein
VILEKTGTATPALSNKLRKSKCTLEKDLFTKRRRRALGTFLDKPPALSFGLSFLFFVDPLEPYRLGRENEMSLIAWERE